MNAIRQRPFLALLVLCLLAAAALRLPQLTAVPPGPHFDEAANGILASEIGIDGDRPIFISSYTGKEVLFFYLAGAVMRGVGSSLFALRITSAFIGLLTVAAAYWLGVELLRDRRVAVLAAVLLAISFWHLIFSRLGFRAITEPLLQAITVAALWRGLRAGRWRWIGFSGVTLGLTGYTYLAARLFPMLLLLALLPLLRRDTLRQQGRYLLAWAGIGLLVLLPLLAFFAGNPDAFWVRIGQVAPAGGGLTIWESLRRSLQMFFWTGDPYIRFNVPQRPLFGWFWGGLLLAGWGLLLLRWPRTQTPLRRAALTLLLLAPFVMILPTALAVNEIVPSNLRAIGLIPFLFYLPALGGVALADALARRWPALYAWRSWATLLLVMIGLGLPLTARTYFHEWGAQAALFYESDGDMAALAAYLDELDTNGKTIYVAALHYQHPTLAFLSEKYPQVKWLPESQALIFPAELPAVYLFPHNSPAPDWAQALLETAVSLPTPSGPDGVPAFTAYELRTLPEVTAAYTVAANFENQVTLLGYDVAPAPAGEPIPLTLYWRIENPPAAAVISFIHLEDAWGHRWSQIEPFAYPAAQWAAGEFVVQRAYVPAPGGAPPGGYRLRLGWFNPATGSRLARLDESGRFAGDSFVIEQAQIVAAAPPETLPSPPIVVETAVQPGLLLLGYDPLPAEVSTGAPFQLALWWQATQPQPPTIMRLELLRINGIGGRILANTQPVHDSYPFSRWQTPTFLIDRQTVRIPDNIESGEYAVQMRLLNVEDETQFTHLLGTIRVTAAERRFTLPPLQFPVAAVFGGEIGLVGYDLRPAGNDAYTLDLVWRALAAPSRDYTVFVHLLTPEGSCSPCVWQQDVMPQQGQYPTSRWLPDEVVVDSYRIELPQGLAGGVYPLEVGLYLAETGQRLQVTVPGQRATDAVELRPLRID